jgi:hypothetical protein
VVRPQPAQRSIAIVTDHHIGANAVALKGLARREVVDYANGLMVDGMNIVGRRKSFRSQKI